MLRMNTKRRNITIVQAYNPTTAGLEDKVNEFYQSLNATISKTPWQDILLMMGNFNAKVGKEVNAANGGMGLDGANEAEGFIDFCLDHQPSLTNTCFTQHPRRLYTRISLDGQTKNLIDYVAISQKWKSSIHKCKTYPGADCDTDHVLLVDTARVKINKQEKKQTVMRRLSVAELTGDTALQYEVEVKHKFQTLESIEEEKVPNHGRCSIESDRIQKN